MYYRTEIITNNHEIRRRNIQESEKCLVPNIGTLFVPTGSRNSSERSRFRVRSKWRRAKPLTIESLTRLGLVRGTGPRPSPQNSKNLSNGTTTVSVVRFSKKFKRLKCEDLLS